MRTISIQAFSYAVHAAVWFIVLATVAAELLPPVKEVLAGGFGHHWVAKSDIAVLLFIAVALLFRNAQDPEDIRATVRGVILSTSAGALAVFGFYLGHYLGMF